MAERIHAEFDELIEHLPQDGSAPEKYLDRFAEPVAVMRDIYAPHIRTEDEIIFPAAARIVPQDILLMIGLEI